MLTVKTNGYRGNQWQRVQHLSWLLRLCKLLCSKKNKKNIKKVLTNKQKYGIINI